MRDYTLIRSDRRTLAIEITQDGKLIVRAPRRCTKAYIEDFLRKKEPWIASHLAQAEKRASSRPADTPENRQIAAALAKTVLSDKLRHYSALMGVTPTHVSITNAEKRFGSCSAENRICFSWRLFLYPQEAIDYVIVHELAHIRYKNHGKEFYAFVASVLPDWKEREALLR